MMSVMMIRLIMITMLMMMMPMPMTLMISMTMLMMMPMTILMMIMTVVMIKTSQELRMSSSVAPNCHINDFHALTFSLASISIFQFLTCMNLTTGGATSVANLVRVTSQKGLNSDIQTHRNPGRRCLYSDRGRNRAVSDTVWTADKVPRYQTEWWNRTTQC